MLHLLLAAAGAACGGKAAPVSTARPAAGTPARAAALLLPDSWRSRVQLERSDSIVLSLPGGESQVQRMSRRATFTLTVGPRAAVTLRLDSLMMSPAPGPAALPVVGTVWTGRMLGTSIEWQTTAGAGPVVEDLSQDVEGLFPHLPAGGVVAGARWNETSTTPRRVDIFEITQQLRTSWVAGRDTVMAGIPLLPLRATVEMEQSGKGSTAGVAMAMTGQGSRSYMYYLLRNGQVNLVTRRDSVDVLISIPSSHQIVPTIRWIRSRAVFTPMARDRAP